MMASIIIKGLKRATISFTFTHNKSLKNIDWILMSIDEKSNITFHGSIVPGKPLCDETSWRMFHASPQTVVQRSKLQQHSRLFRPSDVDVVSTLRRKVAQHRLEGKHNNCSSSVNARYALRVLAMNDLHNGYGASLWNREILIKPSWKVAHNHARFLPPVTMHDLDFRLCIQFECTGCSKLSAWIRRGLQKLDHVTYSRGNTK